MSRQLTRFCPRSCSQGTEWQPCSCLHPWHHSPISYKTSTTRGVLNFLNVCFHDPLLMSHVHGLCLMTVCNFRQIVWAVMMSMSVSVHWITVLGWYHADPTCMRRYTVCKAAMRMPCSKSLRRGKWQCGLDYFAHHIHLCFKPRTSAVTQMGAPQTVSIYWY